GVDCLWLLPMYESPLRDGGYEISNFFALHPDYGSVDDFREFVEQAHQRGMRVIADLVMNHTSADHPWFVESRADPAGAKGDWYVWSETHEYLKRVRAEVDARYPDRLLLAEANQWPEDVVDYFGDGDECQMCFHFSVMPGMFMAVRREDSTPIYEILDRTRKIPANCQW